MIRGFRHRGLKRLYERGDRSRVRPDLLAAVEDILGRLDAAKTPQALDLPGYRLHPLKGDRKGLWSVTVRQTGESFSVSTEKMSLMSN